MSAVTRGREPVVCRGRFSKSARRERRAERRGACEGAQWVAAVGVLLVAAFPRGARGEGRATYGGAMQVAAPQALVSLDPLSPSLGDQEAAALVFEAPFRLDAAGQPRALLATALDPPPPGQGLAPAHARLRLRGDLKFQDGRPLRAADVAASLARGLRDPGGWMLGPIRSVRAAGDDQVEIELARPAPDLALLLASPAALVTPGGSPPGARPIGSGPFAVESLKAGESARLVANPACAAGRPYLDLLVIRSFASRVEESQSYEAGALQVGRQLTGNARRATLDGPATQVGWLAIGRELGDEAAVALRAGLQLGVDRERLRRLVRERSAPVASAPRGADLAAARAHIERALPGARRLQVIVDRSRFDDKAVAGRLLVELSRLGVELGIEVLDPVDYQQRLAQGRYALALGLSAPPLPGEGFGELAALAVVDPAAARAALAKAPSAAGVDLTSSRLLPLYRRAARVVVAPEVRGVQLDAASRPELADAWLKTSPRAILK